MNAIYNHRQQKLFNNALSCLARFNEKLNLRCTQPEESNYAVDFFEVYELEPNRRRWDVALHNHTLQNVLKTQLNRKLEKCELLLIDDDVECRLAIRLHGFNGVTKTHKLTYEDQRSMFPSSPEEGSKVTMDPKTVQSLIDHFGARLTGEISLVCRQDQLTIRSRNDDYTERGTRMGKAVWTEVSVERRYFKSYHVQEDVELTFAMKEFKAAIALADHLGLPVELSFSKGGAPLIIKIHCPVMVAQIFIATSPPTEEASQTSAVRNESVHNQVEDRQHTASQEQRREMEDHVEVRDQDYGEVENAPAVRLSPQIIPESNPVQSGQHAVNHGGPIASTMPIQRDHNGRNNDVLFFGQSSQQETDEIEEEMEMDAEEERLFEEAEARQQQQQPTTSMAVSSQIQRNHVDPITSTMEGYDNENDAPAEETFNDLFPEREDELLSDEEEIPSTQREANAKKAKYTSLFGDFDI